MNPEHNFASLKVLISKLVGDASFRSLVRQDPQLAFEGYRLHPAERTKLVDFARAFNDRVQPASDTGHIAGFFSANPWG